MFCCTVIMGSPSANTPHIMSSSRGDELLPPSLGFKDSSARKRERDVWGTCKEEIRRSLSQRSPSSLSAQRAKLQVSPGHRLTGQGTVVFIGEPHTQLPALVLLVRTYKQVTRLLWASSKVERKRVATSPLKGCKEGRR